MSANIKEKGLAILKVLLIIPAAFVGMFVIAVLYSFISGLFFGLSPDTMGEEIASMLGSLGFVAAAYVLWVLWEKRTFKEIGFQEDWRVSLADFAGGSFLGIALITAALLIAALLGYATYEGVSPGPLGFNIFMGTLLFLFVGISEEIFARGYMVNILGGAWGTRVALAISSALFAGLHLFNPHVAMLPIVNIFLAGLLLGYAFYRVGNLWFPIGLHFTWNLMQGTVFALRVSGMDTGGTFRVALGGPALITGGEFGLEGGLLVTLVTLIGFVVVEIYARRRR